MYPRHDPKLSAFTLSSDTTGLSPVIHVRGGHQARGVIMHGEFQSFQTTAKNNFKNFLCEDQSRCAQTWKTKIYITMAEVTWNWKVYLCEESFKRRLHMLSAAWTVKMTRKMTLFGLSLQGAICWYYSQRKKKKGAEKSCAVMARQNLGLETMATTGHD